MEGPHEGLPAVTFGYIPFSETNPLPYGIIPVFKALEEHFKIPYWFFICVGFLESNFKGAWGEPMTYATLAERIIHMPGLTVYTKPDFVPWFCTWFKSDPQYAQKILEVKSVNNY